MIIYSTSKCQACETLKEHLNKKGVKFEEVDMTKLKVKEQLKLKITSVPTVIWKGKRYEGRTIKELYG